MAIHQITFMSSVVYDKVILCHLFVIAVEILLGIAIGQNCQIKGIVICKEETKLLQFN